LNERQLRYALSVWRERSFIRAAERLNIAQSAISAQVKSLEEEIGFRLFQRTGQGVQVTDVGRTFLQQAEHAISYLVGLIETAHQLRGDAAGSFAVGVGSGLSSYLVPMLLEVLRPELVGIRLEVTTASTQRIHQLLAEDRLDVGFTIETDPRGTPIGLTSHTIASVKMCLIARPDHSLMRRRKVVEIESLGNEPMVMNELAVGYGELVLSMFSDRGMRPKIAAIVDNIDTLKIMVSSGLGIGIVPQICTHNEVRLNQLAMRSLQSAPEATVTLLTRLRPKAPSSERNIGLLKKAFDVKAGPIM
jgi:DNA-binding transcriptional LysR family regulator